MERYNKLNNFLKDKFGERVLKICIDGGFSCPNRDGTCGYGGCIFCSEQGSGEHILYKDIAKQVTNHLESYRGKRANKFIAYFQNFSNTYEKVEILKKKYDSALISDKIVALAIATRPDCIDEKKVKLIKTYQDKYFVWVELGLQSANEETANFINRGFSNQQFTEAVNLLKKYNIPVVVHIMVGLPGENIEDIKNTVNFLNRHDIWGLKIHSTYIVENTKLAKLYFDNKYQPIELDEYIDDVVYILSHINKDIVIHRISGDAPKNKLIAPAWNAHKKWIINGINKRLTVEDIYQGMFYSGQKTN